MHPNSLNFCLQRFDNEGNALDDLFRNGFHSICGWIFSLPCSYHVWNLEVCLSSSVETRIFGPHCKERLRNWPQVIFNSLSPDGLLLSASSVLCLWRFWARGQVPANLWNWATVDSVCRRRGCDRRDSLRDCFLINAEMIAETRADGGVQTWQPTVWGSRCDNCKMNWGIGKSKESDKAKIIEPTRLEKQKFAIIS